MARGGKRLGAGRKPTWINQPTKPVKVPEALIEDILQIARLLDKNEITLEQVLQIANSKAVQAEKNINAIATNSSEKTEQLPVNLPVSKPIEVILTSAQSEAMALMEAFLKSHQKYFRLTGCAGTGKSFLVCHFMKSLGNQKIKFVAGSPTNKAVKNLKNLAASFGVGEIEANTVAQLLGQQPVLNKTTGVEEFVSRQLKPSIGDYDLAIIDEFSMLSSKNFDEMLKEVRGAKTKIIFVGDRAQLPPVGEKEPIVATSELIQDSYTLTEVVRYDGEISKIAAEIRSDSKYDKVLYKFRTSNDHTVTKLDRDEWLDTAVDFFAEENFKHNPDYVRFLVYRNTKAAELNCYVRSQLWGDNCPAYVVGDRLIAKTPVFRPVAGGKGKNKWAIAMNNSEECQVIEEFELQNFDSKRYRDWQYYNVPVKTDSGLKLDLKILTPEFEKKRALELDRLRSAKQWKQFITLSKSFDNVPFAYAITTHKAQGSTIDYVFLDLRDISRCRDLQKILYTGLTRCKKKTFVSF